jgi:hypothetical protein
MSKVLENRVMNYVRAETYNYTVTDLSWYVAQAYVQNITDAVVERYAFATLDLIEKGQLEYGTFGVVVLSE